MYNRLRTTMSEGKATSCMVTRSLESQACKGELSSVEEELIKSNAAVSFIAGTDTAIPSHSVVRLAPCSAPAFPDKLGIAELLPGHIDASRVSEESSSQARSRHGWHQTS